MGLYTYELWHRSPTFGFFRPHDTYLECRILVSSVPPFLFTISLCLSSSRSSCHDYQPINEWCFHTGSRLATPQTVFFCESFPIRRQLNRYKDSDNEKEQCHMNCDTPRGFTSRCMLHLEDIEILVLRWYRSEWELCTHFSLYVPVERLVVDREGSKGEYGVKYSGRQHLIGRMLGIHTKTCRSHME